MAWESFQLSWVPERYRSQGQTANFRFIVEDVELWICKVRLPIVCCDFWPKYLDCLVYD